MKSTMTLKKLVAGLAGAALFATGVSADTLVLKDGRQLTGEVERVDNDYMIMTPAGPVKVVKADVLEHRVGNAPAAPTTGGPTGGGATPPAASPGATGPTVYRGPAAARPGMTPEKVKRTIDMLLGASAEALMLGEVKVARDGFLDVLQYDPRNRQALEGLGFCYMKLDNVQRAMASFEGALAVPETPSRSFSMNHTWTLLRMQNPMRGAKILKDYMTARPDLVDEPLLNAFAICLGRASDEARSNQLFIECVKLYEDRNGKLEAKRPGQKRWGLDWVPAAEWTKKDAKNKEIQAKMDAAWNRYTTSRRDYERSKSQYESAAAAARFRRTNANLGAMSADVQRHGNAMKEHRESYDKLAVTLERPKLPQIFDPVELEPELLASMINGLQRPSAVAVATPPSATPGVTPPTTPRPSATPPVAVNPPRPTGPSGNPARPPTTPPTPPAVASNQPPVPDVTVPAIEAPEPAPARPTGRRGLTVEACGVAVAHDLLVTSARAVEGADRITIEVPGRNPVAGEVVKVDAASGLALVRLKEGRMSYASVAENFGGGAVTSAGFPFATAFEPQAEAMTGSAPALAAQWLVRLTQHPRLAGTPLLANGHVVGIATGSRDDDKQMLPAATATQIKALLAGTPLPAAVATADPRSVVAIVTGTKKR